VTRVKLLIIDDNDSKMISVKKERVSMTDSADSSVQDKSRVKPSTSASEPQSVETAEETNETEPHQARFEDVPSTMTMIFHLRNCPGW
jgi:hypothetical protein